MKTRKAVSIIFGFVLAFGVLAPATWANNTRLLFAERSADQPNVLLKWFYPGDTIGHEFVYSGPEGRALSEETVDVVTVFADPAPMIRAVSASGAQY